MSDQLAQQPIPWRPEFATGNASIDYEHLEMIGLINQALGALDSERPAADIDALLGEVYARISAHFALEEQIMREDGYDARDEHKEDHERLLDDLRDLMDAHEANTYHAARDQFATRLEAWFVNHFKTMDAKLHRLESAARSR